MQTAFPVTINNADSDLTVVALAVAGCDKGGVEQVGFGLDEQLGWMI